MKSKASLQGHSAPVLDLDRKNSTLVSTSADKSARIWDLVELKTTASFTHDTPINSIKFAAKTADIVYFGTETDVYMYDLRTQTPQRLFQVADEINQIDIHFNDRFLGVSEDTGYSHVYDIRQNTPFKRSKHPHAGIASCFKFRPTSPWQTFTAGFDCELRLTDFSRGTILSSFDTMQVEVVSGQMINPPHIHSLASSLNGGRIAVGLGNGLVSVLDVSRKGVFEVFGTAEVHGWSVSALEFTKDHLISGGIDRLVSVFSLTDGLQSTFQGDCGRKVNAMAVIEEGEENVEVAIGGTVCNSNFDIDIFTLPKPI